MKIEVTITDDAGNVKQYVVSGSLPTDEEISKQAKWYLERHIQNLKK